MIERDMAIPLAIHPYSTTSRIVRWLTRRHGKISTVLKGATRPKSPFLGEYELFGTSELLFYTKRSNALFAAKECALLHRREKFRKEWRAMRNASYLSTLVDRTTPEGAPMPEHFEFFEEMLDHAQTRGADARFPLWMEIRFCELHGHAPNLAACVLCSSTKDLRFCASQGGVACAACAKAKRLPTIACAPSSLSTLNHWVHSERPPTSEEKLDERALTELRIMTGAFMMYHFNLNPAHREAALQAA